MQMYTKIMIDISIFSTLINGPGGDEETIEELIEPTPPKYNSG